MFTVKKQEFIEMFLLGLVYLVIGVTGYIIKSNAINLIAFVLATIYSLYTISKRKLRKENDDDDSLQNKNRAGHITFLLMLVILNVFIGVMIILGILAGDGFYITFTFDINFACIILGMMKVTYYFSFMYFDRTE